MGTVGENIKKILNNRGLSVNAAAKKYELKQSTLNEIVTGKTGSPQMETLKKISSALGVSVSELLRTDGEAVYPETIRDGGSVAGEDSGKMPSGFVLIPRYSVEASAGGGSVVADEQVIDRLAFREDWVRHALGVKPSDLALTMTLYFLAFGIIAIITVCCDVRLHAGNTAVSGF
jgi:transcriptional regulator with XRE-family HTH domain